VRAAVPPVEIPDHAHALGVGRPHGKVHAGDAADLRPVRAQLFPRAVVRALATRCRSKSVSTCRMIRVE
jgi:hypothetical protein